MKEETKNIIIIVIVIAVLVGLVALLGGSKNEKKLEESPEIILKNAEKESSSVKESDKKDFIQINVDKYLEYYNGNEKKVILIARPTCHYCQIAEPILQKLSKELSIDINYLNTDNFGEEDEAKLVSSNEFFEEGYGTPILLVVSKSSIIDKVDGLTDSTHYIDFFQRNEIIK